MFSPGKSLLVVLGFFVEVLLSEIHIILNFWRTRLRKFLKSLMWDEMEEKFKRRIDKPCCPLIFIFLNVIIITANQIVRLIKYLIDFSKFFEEFFFFLGFFHRR